MHQLIWKKVSLEQNTGKLWFIILLKTIGLISYTHWKFKHLGKYIRYVIILYNQLKKIRGKLAFEGNIDIYCHYVIYRQYNKNASQLQFNRNRKYFEGFFDHGPTWHKIHTKYFNHTLASP